MDYNQIKKTLGNIPNEVFSWLPNTPFRETHFTNIVDNAEHQGLVYLAQKLDKKAAGTLGVRNLNARSEAGQKKIYSINSCGMREYDKWVNGIEADPIDKLYNIMSAEVCHFQDIAKDRTGLWRSGAERLRYAATLPGETLCFVYDCSDLNYLEEVIPVLKSAGHDWQTFLKKGKDEQVVLLRKHFSKLLDIPEGLESKIHPILTT